MALTSRGDPGEFGEFLNWLIYIETAPGRAGMDKAGEMVHMMLPDGWKSKQQNDRSRNISTTTEGKDKIILSKFKKRGVLNTREMKELTNTHTGLASWIQPLSKNCKEVTQDMVENMEGETREREEMVEIASSE